MLSFFVCNLISKFFICDICYRWNGESFIGSLSVSKRLTSCLLGGGSGVLNRDGGVGRYSFGGDGSQRFCWVFPWVADAEKIDSNTTSSSWGGVSAHQIFPALFSVPFLLPPPSPFERLALLLPGKE